MRDAEAGEQRRDRALDCAADEPARLHDRHGVDLLEPRHHDAGPLHLAARREQDRRAVGGQQAAVQQRSTCRRSAAPAGRSGNGRSRPSRAGARRALPPSSPRGRARPGPRAGRRGRGGPRSRPGTGRARRCRGRSFWDVSGRARCSSGRDSSTRRAGQKTPMPSGDQTMSSCESTRSIASPPPGSCAARP